MMGAMVMIMTMALSLIVELKVDRRSTTEELGSILTKFVASKQ